MGVAEAEVAMGNFLGATSEGFVVQPGVWLQPVQVSACKHITPVLPVVGDPGGGFEVECCSYDQSLVCPQLGRLLRVPRCQNGGHPRETLNPLRNVLDDCFMPQMARSELGVEYDEGLGFFLPGVGKQV